MNANMKKDYTAISAKSIELENAIKANAENANTLENELDTLVSDFNDKVYNDKMKSVKSVNDFVGNVYSYRVIARVYIMDGEVKRICQLKLERLNLAHYYHTKENAKEIDFLEVAKTSLVSMQSAREYALMEKEDAMQDAITKARKAIKSVLDFIGYDKVNVRTNVARVALAQFLQLTGVSVNGLKSIKLAQWIDIITRLIIVNLDSAGKLEVNADQNAVKKIAKSLGVTLKEKKSK